MSANTSFREKVEKLVSEIPEGRVMTYGQLASLCGNPQAARVVGGIAHYGDLRLPWHRVVNKKGGLASGYHGGRRTQKEHLESEGVRVRGKEDQYYIDVDELLWWPLTIGKHNSLPSTLAILLKTRIINNHMSKKLQKSMPSMVFIVGPTASGKSDVALQIAELCNGEIVCADSQTIRKGLDIGTAKPSKQDQQRVKHHLLDVIGPYEKFSAAEFKRQAEKCIVDIRRKGRTPIIVGGTGLYIDALLFDFSFKDKPNTELREKLSKKSVAELQAEIIEKNLSMPENVKNPRHLIRVIESNGITPDKTDMRNDVVVVGLDPGREALNTRIENRVQSMLNAGLVQEAKEVIRTYGHPPNNWDAIGYKLIVDSFSQEDRPDEGVLAERIIIAHRQYAKRQRAWFKRNKNIVWFEQKADAIEYIKKLISRP